MRTIIAALLTLICSPAVALDHGFDPNDPVTQWFETLMMPDIPGARCCGAADAYKVEILEEGEWDGNGPDWVVSIKDGSAIKFPDGKSRAEVPNGLIIHVPAYKVTKPKQSNPTHNAWIFMSVNDGHVGAIFCLVPLLPSL
jgi:hypothetical protein